MFLSHLRLRWTNILLGFAVCSVLMCMTTGCTPAILISTDIPTTLTGRITTDSDILDFGTFWSERLCAVTTPQPDTRWSVVSVRKSAWLSLSVSQGIGNTMMSIRVNRGALAQGIGRDTLLFQIVNPDGTVETARRLPVLAVNDGTIKRVGFTQNFLEEQAGFLASSLQLPPLDTSGSLFISAGRISPDGFPQAHALIACGVQNPLPFVDIGTTIFFEGNNAITSTLALQRRLFPYLSGRTSANATGAINLPNTVPIAPSQILYDENTWHRWSVPVLSNTSSSPAPQSIAQAAWRDSILSPVVPTFIGVSDTISVNQDLRVRWLPTPRTDDMMLLVVPGLDGWRILQAIVNDDQAQYVFPAQQVRTAFAGRGATQITLCLVRYRVKNTRFNNQSAQMVTAIQRGYNMVLR